LVTAGICVALQIIFSLGYRFFSINMRVGMGETMTPALGNMTLDLMIRLNFPVLILDENQRIVWYNKSFTALAGTKSVFYGKRFEEYCPAPLSDIVAAEDPDGLAVEAFDGFYTVKAYPTSVDESSLTITVWQNSTELFEARRLIEEEDAAHPLSDEEISSRLDSELGVKIARRTVAKYREELGIASSSRRRKHL
jgi:hypothetical protein